jgi:hypothetical protein
MLVTAALEARLGFCSLCVKRTSQAQKIVQQLLQQLEASTAGDSCQAPAAPASQERHCRRHHDHHHHHRIITAATTATAIPSPVLLVSAHTATAPKNPTAPPQSLAQVTCHQKGLASFNPENKAPNL